MPVFPKETFGGTAITVASYSAPAQKMLNFSPRRKGHASSFGPVKLCRAVKNPVPFSHLEVCPKRKWPPLTIIAPAIFPATASSAAVSTSRPFVQTLGAWGRTVVSNPPLIKDAALTIASLPSSPKSSSVISRPSSLSLVPGHAGRDGLDETRGWISDSLESSLQRLSRDWGTADWGHRIDVKHQNDHDQRVRQVMVNQDKVCPSRWRAAFPAEVIVQSGEENLINVRPACKHPR